MPIYKYVCKACGKEREEIRKTVDRDSRLLCTCGEPMERSFSDRVGIELVTHTGWARYRDPDGSVSYYRKHRNYVGPKTRPEPSK